MYIKEDFFLTTAEPASPSCRASAWRIGLCHSSRLHFLLHPSCSVGCRVAQHLNPHLVTTPPGALASASCCSLARYSIQRCLQFTSALRCTPLIWLVVTHPSASASRVVSLLFGWLLHIPAPQPLPLIAHHHFHCHCGAHLLPARGLLRCCPLRRHPSRAWGLPRRCPCRARPLPGCGPRRE